MTSSSPASTTKPHAAETTAPTGTLAPLPAPLIDDPQPGIRAITVRTHPCSANTSSLAKAPGRKTGRTHGHPALCALLPDGDDAAITPTRQRSAS
ncbi:hypothetical protein GCM10009528_31220 [Kineococcus aurantiacus]